VSPRKKHRHHERKDFQELFLRQYPTQSRFAESYRTLRTNIQFSFMDRQFRSLLVTSAGEQEGKTTTAANLAYTMALAGKTVLAIDADLRKPSLARIFKTRGSSGLTGLLAEVLGADVQSGSLSDFGVSDLFRLLLFQKKTGVLKLAEGGERVDIYVFDGELTDVKWLTRPEGKKLATLLVKKRLITRDQAEEALSRKKNTGQKVGFILMNMGAVKGEDLAGFITLHMVEGLRTALQFKSGDFSFERLPESFFERPSFDPADLKQIYRQVIIGEEELPYIHGKVSAAVRNTGVEGLFILPSGPRPPNPAELLDSSRMSFLISYLKRRFDVLIIDTPPVLPASDALVLAPQTDGLVLMVRAGSVNRDLVRKAVEQIRHTKANLVGVVLNQVDVRREGYYKYYHKYYSGYYGESA